MRLGQPDPKQSIEGVAAGTRARDGDRRRDVGQRQLEAALGGPETVLPVHRDAGDDHHGDDRDRAERHQQAKREQCAADRLPKSDAQAPQDPGPKAESVDHRERPAQSASTEPAEELLRAVAEEVQADDQPQHQNGYIHAHFYQ